MLTAFTSNNGKNKMLLSAKKVDVIFSQKVSKTGIGG